MDRLTLFALVVFVFAIGLVYRRYSRRIPSPPGPKGYPIIGNLLDIPSERQWKKCTEWANQYGEIVQVTAANVNIVILNSVDVATELLDRRGAIYSDRPHSTMLLDLMGYGWGVNAMQYNDTWRAHRRILHQSFQRSNIYKYEPIQYGAAQELVSSLHKGPSAFWEHVVHFSASVASLSAYGLPLESKDDWFVRQQLRNFDFMTAGATPGRWLVDALPALRHMPCMSFQRFAAEARETWRALLDYPFGKIKMQMSRGSAPLCMASEALAGAEKAGPGVPREVHEQHIKQAAGIVYIAGMDTTASAIHAFILAMAMHPEAQRQAQAEIDSIIGTGRTPAFEDRASLPYVEALMLEVLRWLPIAPIGLPHALTRDDLYGDYVLKKGSIVIANMWAIVHDESLYHDPWSFQPERFIKTETREPERNPTTIGAFGWGRRVCPGRALAEGSIWIAIVSILASCDIATALDAQGRPIDISYAREQSPCFNSGPLEFPCSIMPRTRAADSTWV